MVDHRLEGADGDGPSHLASEIDEKDRHPLGRLGARLTRCRTRQQEHEIRVFGAGDPCLLTVNQVRIAVEPRRRRDPGRVGTGRGLAHAEGLEAQLARRHPREISLLLRLAAVPEQGSHDVHLGVTRRPVATCALDRLQNHARRPEVEAGTPVFARDERGEISRLGERLEEGGGIGAHPVQVAPVLAGEALAEASDSFPNRLVAVLGVREHVAYLRPWSTLPEIAAPIRTSADRRGRSRPPAGCAPPPPRASSSASKLPP